MDRFKIVGAHFRPPAKIVLHNLPVGTTLRLVPEPTNAYDPNAIAVHILPDNIPESVHEDLDQALVNAASSMEALKALPTIHLGYIPKEMAAEIDLNQEVEGTLACEGKDFFIEVNLDDLDESEDQD